MEYTSIPDYNDGSFNLYQNELMNFFIFLTKADRKDCPAAHAKPQKNGRQKSHQGKGGANRRQGAAAEKTPHNQRICNIITLL